MTEPAPFETRRLETARSRTSWIEAGPADGPLMIFVHGWPEHSIVWRPQLERFSAAGWRCIAPDMRGYGGSSVPQTIAEYAVREIVDDMLDLHDSLGGAPAVWIGHDWGSPIVWAIASHHPERCRGIANLCVPYYARGLTLAAIVPLVDRAVYPAEAYPIGQWDYWLYHREQFAQSALDLEADVEATVSVFYRSAKLEAAGKPAPLASVRARGGWFGPAHRAPVLPRDEAFMPKADFDLVVASFRENGFRGANAWYCNDDLNAAYAAESLDFGTLALPVLFVHAAWDTVCETVRSDLAKPMRADCSDLTEVTIDGGHEIMLERPGEVNDALARWTAEKLSD